MLEAKKPAIRRNQEKPKGAGLRRAANKAKEGASTVKSYAFPVKPPELAPGVVPPGVTAPVMALDRKSTRLNSSHLKLSRMPSSA